MSFDLAAFSAARELEPEEAKAIFEALCDGRSWSDLLAADEAVKAFFSELTGKWPELSSLDDDDDQDGSPWAADLEHSPGHVIMNITWPAAEFMRAELCALAGRHGLYVYDPQEGTLYRPGEAPSTGPRSAPEPGLSRWKAKGGTRLAEEVLGALVLAKLEGLRPYRNKRMTYAFDVNDEVEGRLLVFTYPGGRQFSTDAAVGVVHKGVERAMRELEPSWGEPLFMVPRRLRGSWLFDADDIDEAHVEDMVECLRAGMAWAATITDLSRLSEELQTGDTTYAPVVFALAGRQQDALTAIARRAHLAFVAGKPVGTETRDKVAVARLNARFDPTYREKAADVLSELGEAGLGVGALAELYDKGDERATPVLLKWLAAVGYLPVERDLLALLGSQWAKPAAGAPLAAEFRRIAGSAESWSSNTWDRPESATLLVAAAQSFFCVADETVFDDAAELALDRRFHPAYRAPFVAALGAMRKRSGEALAVLVKLLGEPGMVLFALEALGSLGAKEALPVLEKYLNAKPDAVAVRAATAKSKLLNTAPGA